MVIVACAVPENRKEHRQAFTTTSSVRRTRVVSNQSMEERNAEPGQEPLPATVRFVTILGVVIVVGWAAMFWLLLRRW